MLQPVVARLIADDTVDIDSFEIVALKPGVGNPTSLGVYRVSGICHTSKQHDIAYSVVVKHLGDGKPIMDASSPLSWNYWEREIVLFESEIAERIPTSIKYPKYLGQTRFKDGTALFWNADLGDLTKSNWTWKLCLEATDLAAQLNAIDSSDLARFAWLNRTQVEGWLVFEEFAMNPFLERVLQLASKNSETKSRLDSVWRFVTDRSIIERLLSEGRHAFNHSDFNLNNLVPSSDGIIVLDWQLAGVGRIGGDAASIFNTAFELGVIKATRAEFEQLCAVYTERFNQISVEPITSDEVRLSIAITGLFILRWMSFFHAFVAPGETEAEVDAKYLKVVEAFTSGPIATYVEVLNELGV